MPRTSLTYRFAARAAVVTVPLFALFDSKLRSGHHGRRGAVAALGDWARASRDPARPLAWFHASSVGEGLQAESVLRALRSRRPDWQYVYTHFSPSAEGLARRLAVDSAGYAPYDLPGPVDEVLRLLDPDLLVFSKLDLWPELASRAATRGVGVAIAAGTVAADSGRLHPLARSLLTPGYSSVAAAAAIAPPDAERLVRLGVRRDVVRVLGDPRFDSVAARVRDTGRHDPLLRYGAGGGTLVAGSTWPRDEAVLLAAFRRVLLRRPDARLIVVPHEPTLGHLDRLDALARRLGVPAPRRLSVTSEAVPLLVVDRVGVLGSLYGAGTMGFVGGGFGRAGLHSVLEPAAWGIPVMFGPRWHHSRDAELLLEAGAAAVVSDAEATVGQWCRWLESQSVRATAGAGARGVVESGLGAAERTAAMLDELISSRPPRTSPSD